MKKRQVDFLLGYRHPACRLYRPKVNKKKRFALLAFVALCLVTPCTNWLIPVVGKGLAKINPLWVYR